MQNIETENIHYFNSAEKETLAKYYHENGYVIVKSLIHKDLIDKFMKGYTEFKQKKNYIIRAQDTNRPEKLEVNKEGFIEHSMWNPHELPFCDSFSEGVTDIILSEAISGVLSAISTEPRHTLWQSMFFDKSTGTVAHQDHYYLDTEPAGGLIGVWIALEDIDPLAGAFYVCPKTHLSVIANRSLDHNEGYVNSVQSYMEKNHPFKLACAINKGDVIFWHGMTIHGSFENKDSKYSRKSITSHFIPNSYTQLGAKSAGGIVSKPATMPTRNPAIDQWQTSDFKRKVLYFRKSIRYSLNNLFKKPVHTEMKTKDGKYVGKKVE